MLIYLPIKVSPHGPQKHCKWLSISSNCQPLICNDILKSNFLYFHVNHTIVCEWYMNGCFKMSQTSLLLTFSNKNMEQRSVATLLCHKLNIVSNLYEFIDIRNVENYLPNTLQVLFFSLKLYFYVSLKATPSTLILLHTVRCLSTMRANLFAKRFAKMCL